MPKRFSIPRIPRMNPFGKSKSAKTVPQGFPEKKPSDWVGSLAEYYVYLALTRRKIDFQYGGAPGPVNQLGQIQNDFVILSPPLIIRVQGEYWHYEKGADQIAYDTMHKLELESNGYYVIDIDAEDVLKNPTYYVSEALIYKDHSRSSKLV